MMPPAYTRPEAKSIRRRASSSGSSSSQRSTDRPDRNASPTPCASSKLWARTTLGSGAMASTIPVRTATNSGESVPTTGRPPTSGCDQLWVSSNHEREIDIRLQTDYPNRTVAALLSAMSSPAIAATTSTTTVSTITELPTTESRAGHAILFASPRTSRNQSTSENRVGRGGQRGSSGGGRSPPIGGAGGNGGPGGTRSLAVNGSTNSAYNSTQRSKTRERAYPSTRTSKGLPL